MLLEHFSDRDSGLFDQRGNWTAFQKGVRRSVIFRRLRPPFCPGRHGSAGIPSEASTAGHGKRESRKEGRGRPRSTDCPVTLLLLFPLSEYGNHCTTHLYTLR